MTKILAIDDKIDNLITLSAVLKSRIPGCRVITAQSGPDGIEKAKVWSPDTIMLDIKMPGMDGYETCKKLKADKETKHIPVIMISAILTGSRDLIKGLDTGADAYLAKPIDEYVLAAQVKTTLRMKAAEDYLRGQKDMLKEMVWERTAELADSNEKLKCEIDERKKAQKTLKKSEKRYRSLFEQSNDAIIIHGLKGDIIDFNHRALDVLGYDHEQLLNMTFGGLHPEEEIAGSRKALQETIERGNMRFETRFKRSDGAILDVEISSRIIDPVQEGIVQGIVRDITARKKLEAELLQAQKMEAVGRLAGGVAHDFNNMLSIINGYASMALEKLNPSDPLHIDIEEILKAGQHSTNLTRQLLAFARKQTVAPKVLDMNLMVGHSEKMLQRLIGEDISMKIDLSPDLWPVKMDPSQVDQVLVNLAVNSRDAIAGVGSIIIETANVTMNADDCREHPGFVEGQFVLLTFSDSGCGMDKETQSKVFEPFFTTKGEGKGTGLGLSTVYGIIKQNEGFLNIGSEPEQGTIFKIYLPRFEGKEMPNIETKDNRPLDGNETILVVEDEKQILRLCRSVLERKGYTVITADKPGEAIVLCEKHEGKLDLLITDVVMPSMNGKELKNRIIKLRPEIRVLYMSGYTADVITHRGVLTEGMHFIQKPYSLKALAMRVRQVLDEK